MPLHLEVFVAFGAAEAECLRIVADKGYALGRVDRAGAEVACFDPGGMVRAVTGLKMVIGDSYLMAAIGLGK